MCDYKLCDHIKNSNGPNTELILLTETYCDPSVRYPAHHSVLVSAIKYHS